MFNASRMKKARIARAITQEELGKKIGLSPSAVGMYEQQRRIPDADTISRIAWALGISLDWLCDMNDIDFQDPSVSSLEDMLQNCCHKIMDQSCPITYQGILLGMQDRLVAASLIHDNLTRVLRQRLSSIGE